MDFLIEAPDCALVALSNGESGYLHVRFDGFVTNRDGFEKKAVVTTIIESDATILYKSSDMESPIGDDATDSMRAFISFLLACAESQDEESENYSLFEAPVREWAEMYSDELSMIHNELTEEL